MVRITIPNLEIETLQASALKGWDAQDLVISRAFGDAWLKEKRTPVLKVPSVITEGRENNILLNPLHPQFPLIRVSEPEPIHWDLRLFAKKQSP